MMEVDDEQSSGPPQNEYFAPRKANGLALTEYSANTPPVDKSASASLLPEAFLLPDGKPDVRMVNVHPFVIQTPKCFTPIVSSPYFDLESLRYHSNNAAHTRSKSE